MKLRRTFVTLSFFLLISTSSVNGFPGVPTFSTNCIHPGVLNCVGVRNNVFANCESCTSFITCTFGADDIVNCPAGQIYNVTTGVCITGGICNIATLVAENPTTTTDTPSTTTTTTTKAPTVIVINGKGFTKTLTFKTGCVNSCQGQTAAYLPSCSSCSVVFICNSYHQKTGRCYGNAKWDDVLCRCVKWSSTCSAVITPTQQQRHHYRSWWR